MSVATSPPSMIHAMSAPVAKPPAKDTPQGVFSIWNGLDLPRLIEFLRMRPPLDFAHTLRVVSVVLGAPYNSLMAGVESLIYDRQIARTKIEHPPVFVLGHWRSGTTLLHNLLTWDPQFTYPNLYHTLYPRHFLTTEGVVANLTSPLIPKTRPMDNVETGWKLPQEDEVALLLMCLVSPYLMLSFHTRRDIYEPSLELVNLPPAQLQRWKDSLLYFMKKLTIRENKPIVLKSPTHTARIPVILEMFPNAKFVYIYRDPYAVYSSSMHLRKTMFRDNSLAKPCFEGTEDDMLAVYDHVFETYERTKKMVPAGNLYEIRFEELEANPLESMHKLYQGMNFSGWEVLEKRIQQELPSLTSYKKNNFSLDEVTMRKVYNRWKPSFAAYGYPSQLPAE